MTVEHASHRDADLILKLYELRREPVMREARSKMFKEFQPKNLEDVLAVLKPDHPLNTAYRMVTSYWEMAAGLVKHGALHAELFAENCGEGMIAFAKVMPYFEPLRKKAPFAFVNMEWVIEHNSKARRRLEYAQSKLTPKG